MLAIYTIQFDLFFVGLCAKFDSTWYMCITALVHLKMLVHPIYMLI
jgi:hypothetical protein